MGIPIFDAKTFRGTYKNGYKITISTFFGEKRSDVQESTDI